VGPCSRRPTHAGADGAAYRRTRRRFANLGHATLVGAAVFAGTELRLDGPPRGPDKPPNPPLKSVTRCFHECRLAHVQRRMFWPDRRALGFWVCRSCSASAAGAAVAFPLSWIRAFRWRICFGRDRDGPTRSSGSRRHSTRAARIGCGGERAAGQSQLGDRPIGPRILARDKGIPIKVIATVFHAARLRYDLATKPIRTVQDWRQDGPVSTSIAVVGQTAADAGMDPQSVSIVPSAPDPSALVSARIRRLCRIFHQPGRDAAYAWLGDLALHAPIWHRVACPLERVDDLRGRPMARPCSTSVPVTLTVSRGRRLREPYALLLCCGRVGNSNISR